jgi:hypothetical protein
MKKLKLFLITCLLPLLGNSCSYSSSSGWSFSDSDSVKEERARSRAIDRKTDRILKVGRIKDPARARREAKGEVFEEEFLRSIRP